MSLLLAQSTESPPAVQSPSVINPSDAKDDPVTTRRLPNSPNAKSIEVTHVQAGEDFVPGVGTTILNIDQDAVHTHF